MATGPRDCRSGRQTCANVGSMEPDKLHYCPPCFTRIQATVAIPLADFREALLSPATTVEPTGEPEDPTPLGGTLYSVAMVWSANVKCEKCAAHCPAGSLVIGTPGTKTVMRAYDPGTYVWRGPVGITKLQHPDCVPLTNRMVADLRDQPIQVFGGQPAFPRRCNNPCETG
jgi:hypothetical protein